jgi:L-lactate dehydrogenase complex protein LldG
MGQLAARIRGFGKELPSAITVISGVSRTADINLTVTLGMHGPLELVIVVIDPAGN